MSGEVNAAPAWLRVGSLASMTRKVLANPTQQESLAGAVCLVVHFTAMRGQDNRAMLGRWRDSQQHAKTATSSPQTQ